MKTLREIIHEAEAKNVAIGHFNVSDSEGFRSVVDGAKELNVPVIIGVSEGERDFIGIKEIVSLVNIARGNGMSVYINADHTYSVDKAKIAIDAGVDSVIIDGAAKSHEENVAMTKEVVEYARSKSSEILVEAELGFIGMSSKIIDKIPDGVSEETQTKPEEALQFISETGVDLFAPSVGNVHGMVKTGQPKLNIDRIKALKAALPVPMVLHGGSGIADEDFRAAIEAGIRIIHINTELRVAYKEGVEEGIKSGELAPYKFMQEAVDEMRKVVVERLKLFNKI